VLSFRQRQSTATRRAARSVTWFRGNWLSAHRRSRFGRGAASTSAGPHPLRRAITARDLPAHARRACVQETAHASL